MPKLLFTLRSFELGVNDKDSPNLISERELVDAKNAVLGRGFISKRHGYKRYTPSALANPITKLYDFYKNDGTKEFLAVSNSTLYKDTSGTLGSITGALTSSTVQCLTYKDRNIADVVLIADGGPLKAYNGTSVSAVTAHAPTTDEQTDPGLNDIANLTNFRAIAIKKDRIFAAAHPTVKNRVSFCHHDFTLGYAVYDYWPATHFFDVAADENDEITQLKTFRDAIVIFCKRSLWVLYGDGRTLTDYQLHKVNVPAGCISPESVVAVGNDLFYLSDDHVYALYNTDQNYISANPVSVPIENTLKNISRADKAKAVGTFYNNQYLLSFPSGLTLVYDTLLKAWTKWDNVKSNSFLSREGVLFFADPSGLIMQFDENTWNDDGAIIEFMIKTKNMDFNHPVQNKKIRKLWTVAQQYEELSSVFNIKAIIDYVTVDITDISTDQSLVWDEGNWDQALWDWVDIVQNELKVKKKGKNIQLLITNSELDQPLTLFGMTLQYKLKKP